MEHILIIDNSNSPQHKNTERKLELYFICFEKDKQLLDKVNCPLMFANTEKELLAKGLNRVTMLMYELEDIKRQLRHRSRELNKPKKKRNGN